MRRRIYEFPGDKSRRRKRDELAAAIREITPPAKIIAEELKRNSIIRTARMLARRERRGGDRGPGWPS